MKKSSLFLTITMALMLYCSCSNENGVAETARTTESFAKTSEISQHGISVTDSQQLIRIPKETEINHAPKDNLEHAFAMVLEYIEKDYKYQIGMLYDFNFDSIPELIIFSPSMVNTYCDVFDLSQDTPAYLGELIVDDNFPVENSQYISLYHDQETEEYFYCSNTVDFVKNNTLAESGAGYYYGELHKYVFTKKEITAEKLLDYLGDEEGLNDYNKNSNTALSSYDKIKDIAIEPMWEYKNIEDGTYKEIIKNYFDELSQ